jgi:DNA invertase Pin-like site-specific DNA recombinase
VTKATIYCRYSDRPGADTCESNAVQLAACQAYCQARDYEVLAVFEDAAISGKNEDRPLLWQAVETLRRGSVLVAYRADRLARGVYLSEVLHRTVAKKRAKIEVCEGSNNGDSDHDVLVRQILAAVAELERKVIAARTKAAMKHYQKNGLLMGRDPHYGTKRGPDKITKKADGTTRIQKTIVDNPAEMLVVERVLAAHASGLNSRQIARALTEDCVEPRGRRWNHSAIVRIVKRYGSPADG